MTFDLALVSDTHDNLPLTRRAAGFLRERAPDLVLHLGDIVTGDAVGCLHGLPVVFLRGNNDDNRVLNPALERHGFARLADEWQAEVEGVRIAAVHGHVRPRLRELIESHDVVLHGHTHRRSRAKEGRALVVNPGALHRATTKTMAMLSLPSLETRYFEVRRDEVVPLSD